MECDPSEGGYKRRIWDLMILQTPNTQTDVKRPISSVFQYLQEANAIATRDWQVRARGSQAVRLGGDIDKAVT